MTHDPANPFHKLAKELASREKSGPEFSLKERRVRARSPKASERPGKADAEENDAALFMDAVSRIKPLPQRGKGQKSAPGATLGDSLAARMRDNQGQLPSDRSLERPDSRDLEAGGSFGDSRRSSSQEQPEPRAAVSQDESRDGFFDAMRELLPDDTARKEEASAEEAALFSKAMLGVKPVTVRGREIAANEGAAASGSKAQAIYDPAKALQDILDGRVKFALHHTDEFMEGYVVGVDPLVLARLRNGQYSPEKHLDLHGMNARQAYDALSHFIQHAYQRGLRCVVVVTGRGRNSPDGIGVLRPSLQQWLCRDPFKRVVLAFCTAKASDGGPGAVYVLLRKYKKSRGKIIWEHTPSDENFPDI